MRHYRQTGTALDRQGFARQSETRLKRRIGWGNPILAAAAVALGVAAPASAQVVIGNWENTTDGWIDWGTGSPIAAPKFNYSPTGATNGSTALQITQESWGQNLAIKLQDNGLVDDFLANTQFSLDFTVPASEVAGFAEIYTLSINASGYGFVNQQPIPKFQFGFPSGSQRTATVTWDYSALRDGDAGNGEIASNAGYVEFILATNSNAGHGTYYIDNARLASSSLKVDLNGGGAGTLHPNASGFAGWDTLPTSGQGGNPAQNGYPTHTTTTTIASGMVASAAVQATLTSVDVGGSPSSPTYLPGPTPADGPKINSRDMSITGRELDGSGSFTPTKDAVYRDFAFAEAGTTTNSNGTNHRMEIKLEGLDPNTPYKLKFYAYDNSNPQGVFVFTDVTADPLIVMPSGNSSDGNFTPGDGTGGTQYAPAGQFVDGLAMPAFPAGDGFRLVELFATSDGSGKLIFAETTITGLTGATQVLPVLNGFEIEKDTRSWQGNTDSNWSTAGNWIGGLVPQGKGQVANFGNTPNASINVDTPTTVARLNFSGTGLTIGGTNALTLDDASISSSLSGKVTGRTQINLTGSSGNQTINAPLVLAKDTQVWTATAAQTLTVSNLQPSNVVLSKAGAGTLVANNIRTSGLVVNAGTVQIAANGTDTGTSAIGVVTTAGTGKLDLTNNDLVVKSTTVAAVQALLLSGFNGGTWDGPGIQSSAAATDPNGFTALGYLSNADLGATEFSGVPVDADDILVKYTYYGDADLSGNVTLDDYSQFLFGFQNPVQASWSVGDFDYSGTVTLDDFSVFLLVFQNQGGPLGGLAEAITADAGLSEGSRTAMLGAIAAVPEPGTLGVLALAGVGLMGRRRRNRCA